MELVGVLLLCISAITCVGICALAWYYSTVNSAREAMIIQQQGIDRRAAAKIQSGEGLSTSPYGKQEWWVLMAAELLKNPQIQEMLISKVAPVITGQNKSS